MFNLFTPGFEGATHTTWLSKSMGESQSSGWLFQPGYFVGNDGIDECKVHTVQLPYVSLISCHNKPYIATITTFRIYTSHLYLVRTSRC